MDHLPIIGGVAGLATSTGDPKSHLFWLLGGLLAISLVAEYTGLYPGPLATQVIGTFPIVLAYIIGQKDNEARNAE
jgi:hypothetical protein